MSDFKLIPYSIKNIEPKADQIPEGVKGIQAETLWEEGYTGKDIVVAVIDTGVDMGHVDLKNNIIGGKNFTNEGKENNYQDYNGHGTHVAGVIASSNHDGGIVGVAPDAKLLILKALDRNGQGDFKGIIEAIQYATRWRGSNGEKVRVISMSLGGPSPITELRLAIQEAVSKQIAVVVAAGNEGDNNEQTFEYAYPAHFNEVISVSATDFSGNIAPFSNNNDQVDALSYGVDILSTWIEGRYARISGTSMATPHVAGALALLIEKGEKEFNRILTESEIYAMLAKHTVSLNYKKSTEGHGLVKLGYMDKVRDLVDYIEQNF